MRGGDVIVELTSRCGDHWQLKWPNPCAQALTFPSNKIAQNIELTKSLPKSAIGKTSARREALAGALKIAPRIVYQTS
jgi:hypothetical protein